MRVSTTAHRTQCNAQQLDALMGFYSTSAPLMGSAYIIFPEDYETLAEKGMLTLATEQSFKSSELNSRPAKGVPSL